MSMIFMTNYVDIIVVARQAGLIHSKSVAILGF